MKRLYLALTLILSTFFFLSSNVFAQEFTFNITDEMFSYLENIDKMIDLANSYCSDSSNSISCNFFIRYQNDYSYKNLYFLVNRLNQINPSAYIESDGEVRVSNDSHKYIFSSDFSSLSTESTYYNNPYWRPYQIVESSNIITLLLYSSFDIPFKTIDNNTYTFIYNDNTYSIVNDGTNYFPTLYDLYKKFKGSDVSKDNTPILTSYYATIVSKVGWLGEQIISNYVYLSIIGVFIFIFIIELIRRYLL